MAKKEKKEAKQKNSYFKEMKAELKKVVWPTPKELFNNTVAVIGFVLIIAIIVFVLDFCCDNINKYGISRLQEKVHSSLQKSDDSNNEAANENTADQNETSGNGEENSTVEENNDNSSEENLENVTVQEENVESNE